MKFSILVIIGLLATNRGLTQNLTDINKAYDAFYVSKDYDSAVFLFEELAESNPHHHEYVVRLGFANYFTGNYVAAINSFEKAISIGPWPDIYAYFIAASYIKIDSTSEAIHWLEKSVYTYKWPNYERLKRSKVFKRLEATSSYKKIFGLDKVTDNRNDAWLNDLDFAFEKLKLLHFDLFNNVNETEWDEEYSSIRSSISTLDDKEVITRLMKFSALAGEGHTKILPPEEGKNSFLQIPVELYHFDDGTFIVDAIEEYRHLIGKQIVKIGSVNMKELIDKSFTYRGHENYMHHLKMSPRFLTMAETLRDMGATKSLDTLRITYKYEKSSETLSLPTYTGTFLDAQKWVSQDQKKTNQLTSLFEDRNEDFWFESYGDKDAFYIKINYIVDTDKISFGSFIKSAFSAFDNSGNARLIIDLRDCGGGNSSKNRYLLKEIARRPGLEEGFFVLIGRKTYSAAINLATDLAYQTEAVFVGEPTGSSPNFIGESNVLQLPNSKLYLVISNRYHQGGANNSLDQRPWIAPDVYIRVNSNHFFSGIDPALNYVLSQKK